MASAAPVMSMQEPPERNGPMMGPEGLVGQAPSPAPTDNQDQSKAFISKIRQFHADLENISRQYPAFSKAAKQAKDAITQGMSEVLKGLTSANAGAQASTLA